MNSRFQAAKRIARKTYRQPYSLVYRLFDGPDPWRRRSSRQRKLPDFLLIGGMRCGSTSLYQLLIGHPEVVPPLEKEIYFFERRFDRGLDWYRAHFPLDEGPAGSGPRNSGLITGEATVNYLFYPGAARRAAELLPEVKLLVILRNPIDRAYSHYWHQVRWGNERLSFAEAVDAEPDRLSGGNKPEVQANTEHGFNYHHFSYLARGHYAEQLAAWLEFFPRQQILILFDKTFFGGLPDTLTTIWDFLDLTPAPVQNVRRFNRAVYPPMAEELRQRLVGYFRPHNQRLAELLDMAFDWDQ